MNCATRESRNEHPLPSEGLTHGLLIGLVLLAAFFIPSQSFALNADELLLVVNRNSPESLRLAEYYRDRRQVPADQLVQVSLPLNEELSRNDYNSDLAEPLRRYLDEHSEKPIRCLVLFFGIPLRISAPPVPAHQEQDLRVLKQQLDALQKQEVEGSHTKKKAIQEKIATLRKTGQIAAVDSELALLRAGDYPLDHWLKNPFFPGQGNRGNARGISRERTLFVSRLDGPDSATVRRMIDDSLAAERTGLDGTAYFDARWPEPEAPSSAYALYDASLHRAAAVVDQISSLSVVVDQDEALLQPGTAPGAALYCGWYSLGRYVDAFDWQRGAVAYHIASSECTTLKAQDNRGWCKSLLEDGVAATIGPVAEPYVQGFPLPELFFSTLLDGYYTLVESYFLSLPYLSWRMILVGDPLYRPFRNH